MGSVRVGIEEETPGATGGSMGERGKTGSSPSWLCCGTFLAPRKVPGLWSGDWLDPVFRMN